MCIFVRLRRTIDIRLERHAPARFLVIILGPNTNEGHVSHIQMGEAAAMLLQDEVVVEAAYSAVTPETFLEAVDIRMNKLTVIPHIHRPTDQGVEKRLSALTAEMHALAGTDHTNWVGGERLVQDGVHPLQLFCLSPKVRHAAGLVHLHRPSHQEPRPGLVRQPRGRPRWGTRR
eukprot:m.119771 g.119771  ORF g.119771 m.119771 type:complete len:174 (+) comp13314_c1_seq1:1237-1758(+)